MGKSSGSTQRELTEEEKRLIGTQEESLQQAMDVYAKQFNLSEADRSYFDKIYRGDLDPNDPKVQTEVAKRLENTPKPTYEQFKKNVTTTDEYGNSVTSTETDMATYEKAMSEWTANKDKIVQQVSSSLGTEGVDELLFKAVVSSDAKVQTAFSNWQTKAQTLGTKYTDSLGGLSKEFTTKLTDTTSKLNTDIATISEKLTSGLATDTKAYTDKMNELSGKMGTADANILAQTKGANLAGISQSYAEARKQLEGTLAQRGLADSGVGIGALSSSYTQEAMAKANATSASYQQAVQQSDVMRQNQMGVTGQIYGANTNLANTVYGTNLNASNAVANNTSNLANTVYNTNAGVGSQVYGIQSGLDTAMLQNSLNANQQNIANLTTASGVSQGVYGGAQNYLSQAGNTANQTASAAGSTALGIGNMQAQYASGQAAAASAETAGLYGAIGTGAGIAVAMSDFRFKNNITYIKTVNGVRYYTWEWNTLAKEYLGEDKLYEPYGVIAQELRYTNPELVFEDDNGYLFVDYTSLEEK